MSHRTALDFPQRGLQSEQHHRLIHRLVTIAENKYLIEISASIHSASHRNSSCRILRPSNDHETSCSSPSSSSLPLSRWHLPRVRSSDPSAQALVLPAGSAARRSWKRTRLPVTRPAGRSRYVFDSLSSIVFRLPRHRIKPECINPRTYTLTLAHVVSRSARRLWWRRCRLQRPRRWLQRPRRLLPSRLSPRPQRQPSMPPRCSNLRPPRLSRLPCWCSKSHQAFGV